jgi:hypothetical protein
MLTEEQIAYLRLKAAQEHISPSAILRRLIDDQRRREQVAQKRRRDASAKRRRTDRR